ncbi:hypothetical protein BV25DRAFT_226794 [Artomyces pyxidatus]|uniref:Uncharacterized protein n=1 Tax=Artomyces pyxidatus TaxID=48021 RepID=A0ACB8SHY7_9AGAM|nr:hypothetical protein BV25DRAFT_226794 [Artomyces pyxidatus]
MEGKGRTCRGKQRDINTPGLPWVAVSAARSQGPDGVIRSRIICSRTEFPIDWAPSQCRGERISHALRGKNWKELLQVPAPATDTGAPRLARPCMLIPADESKSSMSVCYIRLGAESPHFGSFPVLSPYFCDLILDVGQSRPHRLVTDIRQLAYSELVLGRVGLVPLAQCLC